MFIFYGFLLTNNIFTTKILVYKINKTKKLQTIKKKRRGRRTDHSSIIIYHQTATNYTSSKSLYFVKIWKRKEKTRKMAPVRGDGMRGLAVFISDIRNCKSLILLPVNNIVIFFFYQIYQWKLSYEWKSECLALVPMLLVVVVVFYHICCVWHQFIRNCTHCRGKKHTYITLVRKGGQ